MIINSMGITTTNDFLQILYGGDKFMPIVTVGDIVGGIIELGIVTVIAALYPILVVRKIVPLDAIARD